MKWLVDIDKAVSDGLMSSDAGVALKSRARDAMITYAIDLALFAGIVMVVIGAVAWVSTAPQLFAAGLGLSAAGILALLAARPRLRLLANATAIIGVTLAAAAVSGVIFPTFLSPMQISLALGIPTVFLGYAVRRFAPKRLAVFGGWVILLGAALHIYGLSISGGDQTELFLVYTAAVVTLCGVALDVRFVTGLAMLPLAASLSSRSFYSTGMYGIAIYEVTLTILQMGIVAAVAFAVSGKLPDRYTRHSRLLGQLALIWVNVAFWIGSLWGDVVGFFLWGPRWRTVTAEIPVWRDKWDAWHKAVSDFEQSTLVISADVFAVIWALLILGAAAIGALRANRGVLNIAVTFGAIHFYTQYFERYHLNPKSFLFAGLIAILAAWAIWAFNRRTGKKDRGS